MEQEITPFEMADRKLTEISLLIVDLRRQKEILEEEEKRLMALFSAWHHILEAEKPKARPEPTESYSEQLPNFATTVLPLYSEILPATERSYGAKTESLKNILGLSGASGMTPKELHEALLAANVAISKSFTSNALFRLKKDNQVVALENGRYALTRFVEPSEPPQDQQQTPP